MDADSWIILVSAIAMFALAAAAFISIRQNKNIRKHELEHKLVDEVREWTTNMAKSVYGKSIRDIVRAQDVESAGREIWVHIVEIKEEIMGVSILNAYVRRVTIMKSLQGLQEPVAKLIECSEAYVEFLDEWHHAMVGNIAMPVDEKAEEADKYQKELEKSADDILEEAARIKTRYIG